MPLYEFLCEPCRTVVERYLPRFDTPEPVCEACCGPMKRLISTFNPIWTRSLGLYGDPKKEGYRGDKPLIAWRRKSSRRADGKPERVELRTHQEQVRYCKEEGLLRPDEVGALEVGKDGKSISSQGLPGSWTGVPSRMCDVVAGGAAARTVDPEAVPTW